MRIGSHAKRGTLKFSVLSNIRPMIEKYPLERAGEA
jgi:hypothetical protein